MAIKAVRNILLGSGLAGLGWLGRREFRRFAVRTITDLPRWQGDGTPNDFNMPYKEVTFTSRDNLNLHGWHIPLENGKAIIIIAHGYGGSKVPDLRHAVWLRQAGYSVFMFDFRGHGLSDGPQGTSAGYLERLDMHGAVDYLLGQGERRIGVYGISMGGAIAILAAAENPHISAVVADSPFAHFYRSIAREAANRYRLPMWFTRPVARYVFKAMADYHGYKPQEAHPATQVSRISPRPLFLIHGSADKLTPVENSEILYKLAREPKELWIEQGMEHVEVYDKFTSEYIQRVSDFFAKVDWEATLIQADPTRWQDHVQGNAVKL